MKYDYLPLGSIVRLKNGIKPLMIIGSCFCDNEDQTNKYYDYCGCIYPEGVISTSENILFNHIDIEEIIKKAEIDNDNKKIIDSLFYKYEKMKYPNENNTEKTEETIPIIIDNNDNIDLNTKVIINDNSQSILG